MRWARTQKGIKLATPNFVISHSRVAFLTNFPAVICIHIFKFLNTLNWFLLPNKDTHMIKDWAGRIKYPQKEDTEYFPPTQFYIQTTPDVFFSAYYKRDVDSESFVLVAKPTMRPPELPVFPL
tara:strand:- start:1779 stop:2147 length:369 start_codon:yes stop_codon:yes gene_type:complete